MSSYSETPKKSRRPGRPGHLAAAAKALGVDRSHLSRVARGERSSLRLMDAYKKWLEANPPA